MKTDHINLSHLKGEIVCSLCGCEKVKSERRCELHTNGNWNEWREFECGRSIQFSPNFMRIVVVGECVKSEEYRVRHEKRVEALRKLKAYIKTLACDEAFKNTLDAKTDC